MSHKVIIRCDFKDCDASMEIYAGETLDRTGWLTLSRDIGHHSPFTSVEFCPEHAKLIGIPEK